MTLEQLRAEVAQELTSNILPFWINRMTDPAGGYYGRRDGNGNLVDGAEKGLILNARILWTFSQAYRILGKPEYLEAATRAKDYIADHLTPRASRWIRRSSFMLSLSQSTDLQSIIARPGVMLLTWRFRCIGVSKNTVSTLN